MRRESSGLDAFRSGAHDDARRKGALEVLLEARERLLAQMAEDVLAHSDVFVDATHAGVFSFEFQEIEDRYSVRLNSLNTLLEHLDHRQPVVRHRVETFSTTLKGVKKELKSLLDRFDEWDLADFEVVRQQNEDVLVIAVLVCDEFAE